MHIEMDKERLPWRLNQSALDQGCHCCIEQGDAAMSYHAVLEALSNDEAFRDFFIHVLKDMPQQAYRWETPAYTQATLGQAFEFVVLNDAWLDRQANPRPFIEYIADVKKSVVSFPSLGKDAHLVVPSNLSPEANYCHLASFTRTAPLSQQQELWRMVGSLGLELASEQPRWLSSAGGGVAWLHLRFDTRPKYYHHAEFKKRPQS